MNPSEPISLKDVKKAASTEQTSLLFVNSFEADDIRDVFISYSHRDYEDEKKNVIPGNEVSKIIDTFQKANITFWLDHEIHSGDFFDSKIVRNIKSSRVFVFLSTANSNKSEWTANEIAVARMMRKKVIPVRIDNSDYHEDSTLYLARCSHIDYADNPELGLQKLVEAITAATLELRETDKKLAAQREEERLRQEEIAELESKIAALESRQLNFKKILLQKETELSLAKVDLEACEKELKRLQDKFQEKRNHIRKDFSIVATAVRTPQKKPLKIKVGNGVEFDMIPVEGGAFVLAALKSLEKSDQNRDYSVTLSNFYIGETVVTQELWNTVMGRNPSERKIDKNLPVEHVSYNDCKAFICELNKKTKRTFRLPTEAEWEYAASGGSLSHGWKYAGGEILDEVAWHGGRTQPVRQKKDNELGLFDMSGNVWEWCEDVFKDYTSSMNKVSKSTTKDPRVCRGGCADSKIECCLVTHREGFPPYTSNGLFGLRLAMSSEE